MLVGQGRSPLHATIASGGRVGMCVRDASGGGAGLLRLRGDASAAAEPGGCSRRARHPHRRRQGRGGA
eukprot:4879659-Pleurochrysis_carterae.AAC.1